MDVVIEELDSDVDDLALPGGARGQGVTHPPGSEVNLPHTTCQ